jgi:hypothetical protein
VPGLIGNPVDRMSRRCRIPLHRARDTVATSPSTLAGVAVIAAIGLMTSFAGRQYLAHTHLPQVQ